MDYTVISGRMPYYWEMYLNGCADWYVNVQIDAHGKATELHGHHNARDAVQSLMDAWYTLAG